MAQLLSRMPRRADKREMQASLDLSGMPVVFDQSGGQARAILTFKGDDGRMWRLRFTEIETAALRNRFAQFEATGAPLLDLSRTTLPEVA